LIHQLAVKFRSVFPEIRWLFPETVSGEPKSGGTPNLNGFGIAIAKFFDKIGQAHTNSSS
jgi:hypothetical protein